MLNYGKSEYFRVKKSLGAYILPLLSLIGITGIIFFTKRFGMPTTDPIDLSMLLKVIIFLMVKTAPFFVLVAIEVFYADEFKQKTVGRPLEAGYSRESIFFGKLLGIYLYSIGVILLTMILALLGFKMFFAGNIAFMDLITPLTSLGSVMIGLTFFVALYIILSIRVIKEFWKFILYYVFLSLHKVGEVIFTLIGLDKLTPYLRYWPGAVISDLTQNLESKIGSFGTGKPENVEMLMENFPLRLGITFALGIVLMVVALQYFKKKEI